VLVFILITRIIKKVKIPQKNIIPIMGLNCGIY